MPGEPWAAEILARRRAEREELLEVARRYVGELGERIEVVGAAVVGSVARGDFNVWSDIDVVVVAATLPGRALDRAALLGDVRPARVQPVGLTPAELQGRFERRDPLVRELAERGVFLAGEQRLRALLASPGPSA